MTDRKLFREAAVKLIFGLILLGILLFIPAGSFGFTGAWIFIAVLFVPMTAAGIVMLKKSPELLRKRLGAKESENEQKTVVMLSGIMFLLAFILAGLDFRFSWTAVPETVQYISAAVFLIGYALYFRVLYENAYLSRTVEVQEGQKVIDTGLYGSVRHPMYLSTLIMFLMMPLVLGSLISFAVMCMYIPVIVKRIKNEEKVLASGLEGYRDYMENVRYRLVPFIW